MEFPRALFLALCSSLYTCHLLTQIIRCYGKHFHCYVDNTQLYVTIKADDKSQIMKLETRLHAVRKQMSENFLLLNSDQTNSILPYLSSSKSKKRPRSLFDTCATLLTIGPSCPYLTQSSKFISFFQA